MIPTKTNMLPNDQITPIITTNIEIKVALTERKNRNRMNAVISKVKIIKSVISFLCQDRDFSQQRVKNRLDELEKTETNRAQSLDKWFS